jgi:hypothetical protein
MFVCRFLCIGVLVWAGELSAQVATGTITLLQHGRFSGVRRSGGRSVCSSAQYPAGHGQFLVDPGAALPEDRVLLSRTAIQPRAKRLAPGQLRLLDHTH